MLWLKEQKPAKPPKPPQVIGPAMLASLRVAAQVGATPMAQYLATKLPKVQYDRWMQQLPLSSAERSRLDRMVAVLMDPINRTRALLVSGTLDLIETDAVKNGAPKAYEILSRMVQIEMAKAGPPLPAWSEAVLGVFFGRPAANVMDDAKTDENGKPTNSGFNPHLPNGTPAEQADNTARSR